MQSVDAIQKIYKMWEPITESLALQATLGLGEKGLRASFLLQHCCVSLGVSWVPSRPR